jgi:hypothetical protein
MRDQLFGINQRIVVMTGRIPGFIFFEFLVKVTHIRELI